MKNILIIDDSAFMRNILKELLTNAVAENILSEPLTLYEADGKTNALKEMIKAKPDIMLVDIVMKESETEGIEFVNAIKDKFSMKKIIIISSIGQSAIWDECKRLGILHYLQKPFEKNEVISVMNEVLKI